MRPDAVRQGPLDQAGILDWGATGEPSGEVEAQNSLGQELEIDQTILRQAADQLELDSFRQPVEVQDQDLHDLGTTTYQMVRLTGMTNEVPLDQSSTADQSSTVGQNGGVKPAIAEQVVGSGIAGQASSSPNLLHSEKLDTQLGSESRSAVREQYFPAPIKRMRLD